MKRTQYSPSAMTAVILILAFTSWPTKAVAGITITKAVMTDKTNGGEVTTGKAHAVLSIEFIAEATTTCKDKSLTYTWDFGDGTTATGATVTHVYGEAGAGNRSPSVTVTDNCGDSETKSGLSVAAISGIEVKKIGDKANPTNNGRICFDAVRNVEAIALPSGVDGSDLIDWSLQVGLVHSKKADMSSGDLPKLSEFPSQNSFWGAKTMYISIDGPHVPGQQGELILTGTPSFVTNPKQVKTFYDFDKKQNPSQETPQPPNWFFYYTQTAANKGTMHYNGNGNYCDFNDNPTYPAYLDNAMDTYSTPQAGANANQTLTHIDAFAWSARHEWRHHEQATMWWGAGGYVAAQDTDRDWVPDNLEAGFGAGEGGPYDNTMADTHADGNLVSDVERHCVHTQEVWAVGSADGEDWAHPGNQWP